MHSKSSLLLFGLTLILFVQCRTKTNADKFAQATIPITSEAGNPTKFDTIISRLKNKSSITKDEILKYNLVDSTYANSSIATYTDTIVQLNKNIFYCILSLPDHDGICSHSFIIIVDEKNKKINSKYLQADCDIDYSVDSYELYSHRIVTSDTILLTKTTIFQKKKRVSNDENENIDHKDIQNNYFSISKTGQITSSLTK